MHAAREPQPVRTGPVVVEVVGTPGAGKTTLVAALVPLLEASGLHARGVADAAREVAGRGRVASVVVPRLPARVASIVLWRAFAVARLLHAGRYLATHPRLAALLWRTQRNRPEQADARRRKVLHWYLRMLGARCYLVRNARPGEALVLDEGVLHRVVQLFASPVERPDAAQISAYLDLVPPPDVLVAVRAPADVCFERVEARGRWEALAGRDAADVATFVDNAGHAVELAVADARRRGWVVVEIDNGAPTTEPALAALAAQLPAAVASAGNGRVRGERARRVPVEVPRPGRLLHTVETRLRPPPIARGDVDVVLAAYGLRSRHRPVTLTTGRRNANVAVHTDRGELVLRRHRAGWAHDAVLHEHSILTELARRGIAVPQLLRTVAGDTVVEQDGRLHALFVREPGENLAGMRLSGPRRLELVHEAGAALARLHLALVDFTPAGRHHLTDDLLDSGDDSDGGESDESDGRGAGRGRTGGAAALDRLAGEAPVPDDAAAAAALRTLRSRAGSIDERLAGLEDRLRSAELPRTVIHGDYGVHNLLYRPDGSALVLDFELARRGRRLVDLVSLLARCTPDDARALFAGYGGLVPMTADEQELLPAFWEHHWLHAALRSWQNHYDLGGTKRLRTALRRLEQADRPPPVGEDAR